MARSIDIPPDLEGFIDGLVSAGHYDDASAVVRRALLVLQEIEVKREAKLVELRRLIQEGLEDRDGEEWDLEEFKARLNAEFEARRSAAE